MQFIIRRHKKLWNQPRKSGSLLPHGAAVARGLARLLLDNIFRDFLNTFFGLAVCITGILHRLCVTMVT
jgi:hypothetical protein